MATVVVQIYADGRDVSSAILPRLIELTVTDGVEGDTDSVQFTLDDKGGQVEPPRTGVKLRVIGGYKDNLRDFGEFVVDNVSYEGYPQRIAVSAQSADALGEAKTRKTKGYSSKEYPTYREIFQAVADELKLSLKADPSLMSQPVVSEAQAEEAGVAFLRRIGRRIDAAVTVKSGNLVVVKKGGGKTASGLAMPVVAVAPGLNLLTYSVSEDKRPTYSTVRTTYWDRSKNRRGEVEESTGLDGPELLVRNALPSEKEAREAAQAKSKEVIRSQASASFTINGTPMVAAEAIIEVSSVRPRVDGRWRATSVSHVFSSTGAYVTELQCEKPS